MAIPLTSKVQGRFLQAMQERSTKWANARIAVRIEVPEELEFWYWDEYGTASKGDVDHGASGHSYTIVPVTAKGLVFPQGGQMTFHSSVEHPGVKPSRSVTKVMPDIRDKAVALIHQAFIDGAADDPEKLHAAVLQAVAAAKDLIVHSMAQNIPGVRAIEPSAGKLGGERAADAFDREAQIVDHSGG